MERDNFPIRKTLRLKNYNYSSPGVYFVTVCVRNGEDFFGNIINGVMRMNKCGRVIHTAWQNIESWFENVKIDTHIVMPDHTHALIRLLPDQDKLNLSKHRFENSSIYSAADRRQMLLPKIIGYFKMNTAKQINNLRHSEGQKVWHRNYYDHIVRDAQDYNQKYWYIINNPKKWSNK